MKSEKKQFRLTWRTPLADLGNWPLSQLTVKLSGGSRIEKYTILNNSADNVCLNIDKYHILVDLIL